MNEKIILHCGAPKTGSTSFQHMLYANRDRLLKAGFYCPAVSRKKRLDDDIRILLAELGRERGGARAKAKIKYARSVIDRIFHETGCHTLIISNEGVLGKPFESDGGSFYPKAENQAKMISSALAGRLVEVRFFIRDYAEFLPSWYVQQVRMGSKLTLDEFIEQHNFQSVSWLPVVAALKLHFGADNVGIYDHAALKKNSQAILSDAYPAIMAVLGEDTRQVLDKNKSIGMGMVSTYRRWNRIADRLIPTPSWRKTIRHIGRRYVLLPLERFSSSEKVRLPPELAAQLSARFKADMVSIRPDASFTFSGADPV